MIRSHRKAAYLISFSAVIVAIFGIWRFTIISPNSDEFIQYHRLACFNFKFASEHEYLWSCSGANKANILGFTYHRNFPYTGAVSNLFYAPFYFLNQTKYSHYLYGIVMVTLFGWLLIRALKLPWYLLILPLVYVPLLYQSMHDAGPIRIALVAHPLLICLTLILFSEYKKQIKYLALFGIFFITAIAIEDKPFFIYLIPQVIILAIATSYYHYRNITIVVIKNNLFWAIQIVVAIALAILLVLVITQITTDNSKEFITYIKYLIKMKTIYIANLEQELTFILRYSFSPTIFVTDRWVMLSSSQMILSFLSFIPLISIALFQIWKERKGYGKYLAFSFGTTCLIFLIMRNTYLGHHFIFLHIPLIIAIIIFASTSLQRYFITVMAMALVVVVTTYQIAIIEFKDISDGASSPDREILAIYLAKPEIAQNSIINYTSSGGYFMQSLFGHPDQLVTHIQPINLAETQSLEVKLKKLNRKYIINLCRGCTKDELQPFFPKATITEIDLNVTQWHAWQLEYK